MVFSPPPFSLDYKDVALWVLWAAPLPACLYRSHTCPVLINSLCLLLCLRLNSVCTETKNLEFQSLTPGEAVSVKRQQGDSNPLQVSDCGFKSQLEGHSFSSVFVLTS